MNPEVLKKLLEIKKEAKRLHDRVRYCRKKGYDMNEEKRKNSVQ